MPWRIIWYRINRKPLLIPFWQKLNPFILILYSATQPSLTNYAPFRCNVPMNFKVACKRTYFKKYRLKLILLNRKVLNLFLWFHNLWSTHVCSIVVHQFIVSRRWLKLHTVLEYDLLIYFSVKLHEYERILFNHLSLQPVTYFSCSVFDYLCRKKFHTTKSWPWK